MLDQVWFRIKLELFALRLTGIQIPGDTQWFPELKPLNSYFATRREVVAAFRRCDIRLSHYANHAPCISAIYNGEDARIFFQIEKKLAAFFTGLPISHAFRAPRSLRVQDVG